jgi:hypothetical protein
MILLLGSFLAVGCATSGPETKVDSSGLVLIPHSGPGELFAHPSRSIDDYDDFLVSDVGLSYAPKQTPLSEEDLQRFRTMAYGVVVREIPAAGYLAARGPGPCTVKLGVQFDRLEFPGADSRKNGSTTVILELRDSVTNDPIVRYGQHRELSVGMGSAPQDLKRLESTLEIVAEDVRLRLREQLALNQTGARSAQGCKGVIGAVRKKAKEGKQG